MAEALEEMLRGAVGEGVFPGVDGADAGGELTDGVGLVEEAVGPGAGGLGGEVVEVVGGDEEAAELRVVGLEEADEFEAVHESVAEVPVHEEDGGEAVGKLGEHGGGVREFIQHGEVAVAGERASPEGAGVRTVIDQADGKMCAHGVSAGSEVITCRVSAAGRQGKSGAGEGRRAMVEWGRANLRAGRVR